LRLASSARERINTYFLKKYALGCDQFLLCFAHIQELCDVPGSNKCIPTCPRLVFGIREATSFHLRTLQIIAFRRRITVSRFLSKTETFDFRVGLSVIAHST
jgi:hypothetical protein